MRLRMNVHVQEEKNIYALTSKTGYNDHFNILYKDNLQLKLDYFCNTVEPVRIEINWKNNRFYSTRNFKVI